MGSIVWNIYQTQKPKPQNVNTDHHAQNTQVQLMASL